MASLHSRALPIPGFQAERHFVARRWPVKDCNWQGTRECHVHKYLRALTTQLAANGLTHELPANRWVA
eukprot:8009698-Prorocentrum_lima.AAC.1